MNKIHICELKYLRLIVVPCVEFSQNLSMGSEKVLKDPKDRSAQMLI
jgi:hypothetical protein